MAQELSNKDHMQAAVKGMPFTPDPLWTVKHPYTCRGCDRYIGDDEVSCADADLGLCEDCAAEFAPSPALGAAA